MISNKKFNLTYSRLVLETKHLGRDGFRFILGYEFLVSERLLFQRKESQFTNYQK